MSRHGDVVFDWADGEHTFRLGIGQLRELQERCNAGPLMLARRLIHGDWRLDDLRETIRLGLIGGGLEPSKALSLVRNYVDERPLMESVEIAGRIINAALVGPGDEERPKDEALEQTATA
jgi:hypothetical protein